MEKESKSLESWAVVELFGHNVIAGFVSEQSIGGGAFVRVDAPETEDQPAYTKFFSPQAIYAITPTTEEHARQAAHSLRVRPIERWIVPERPALPVAQDNRNPYYDNDEDWQDEEEEEGNPF